MRIYVKFYKIYVEITDICHLSCSFCTPKKAQRGIMPLPLFENIMAQITHYTQFVSLHVLGDPLCVENIATYIAIAQHYNVKLDIVSSGAFLQQKHFHLLTKEHIHQVSFSLDALFNNKYLCKNINAYLDTIIGFYNYASIYAPKLYINLRLFGQYDYTPLLQRFPNAQMQIEKRRLRLAKHFFLRFHKPFVWHTAKQQIKIQGNNKTQNSLLKKPYCLGAIKQLAILADGVVVPCCIDAHAQIPLGDLSLQDFQTILYADAMQTMQHAQRTHNNLPNLCQSCTFRGV